jgi:hypothetical protein
LFPFPVDASANDFSYDRGVIACIHFTDDFALHITEGVRDNRTASFLSDVKLHITEFIALTL